jgi:hypothetical protein
VNKKQQKNFVNFGHGGFNATGPESQKFLRRFFQKAAAFLLRDHNDGILLPDESVTYCVE